MKTDLSVSRYFALKCLELTTQPYIMYRSSSVWGAPKITRGFHFGGHFCKTSSRNTILVGVFSWNFAMPPGGFSFRRTDLGEFHFGGLQIPGIFVLRVQSRFYWDFILGLAEPPRGFYLANFYKILLGFHFKVFCKNPVRIHVRAFRVFEEPSVGFNFGISQSRLLGTVPRNLQQGALIMGFTF